jgi:hypothetical protein
MTTGGHIVSVKLLAQQSSFRAKNTRASFDLFGQRFHRSTRHGAAFSGVFSPLWGAFGPGSLQGHVSLRRRNDEGGPDGYHYRRARVESAVHAADGLFRGTRDSGTARAACPYVGTQPRGRVARCCQVLAPGERLGNAMTERSAEDLRRTAVPRGRPCGYGVHPRHSPRPSFDPPRKAL